MNNETGLPCKSLSLFSHRSIFMFSGGGGGFAVCFEMSGVTADRTQVEAQNELAKKYNKGNWKFLNI